MSATSGFKRAGEAEAAAAAFATPVAKRPKEKQSSEHATSQQRYQQQIHSDVKKMAQMVVPNGNWLFASEAVEETGMEFGNAVATQECDICLTDLGLNDNDEHATSHKLCSHCFRFAKCFSCAKHFTKYLIGDGGRCGYCTTDIPHKSRLTQAVALITQTLVDLADSQQDQELKKIIAFAARDMVCGATIKMCRDCNTFKGYLLPTSDGICETCFNNRHPDSNTPPAMGSQPDVPSQRDHPLSREPGSIPAASQAGDNVSLTY